MTILLPEQLKRILSATPSLRHSYLVGGCVRDAVLGLPQKDYDVEVHGVDFDQLESALSRWGGTDVVGRSFGTVKLNLPSGEAYDFSLPRRDSKIGAGHRGFKVEVDPELLPREAAERRDFTINSMMWDIENGVLLDFYGGLKDLQNRILRHTSGAFTEDPLRVLRGMQFAARFGLSASEETLDLCRSIIHTHTELAKERIEGEWRKWASESRKPSLGLLLLKDTGWIVHYPELAALVGVPQDAQWHPEGDVFTHTLHTCDAMAALEEWQLLPPDDRAAYMFAILCHDFGKPETTRTELRGDQNRIISPSHEMAGVPLAESFLKRIHQPLALKERVAPLVANHMVNSPDWTARAVRRLSHRLLPESIEGLTMIMKADAFGRPPLPQTVPRNIAALISAADLMNIRHAPPPAILLGRHLLEEGWPPGREVGHALRAAYDAQLEGDFSTLEGARSWAAAWRKAQLSG